MADITHLVFYLNGVERGQVEWDQDGPEEVLGGPGRSVFTIQDRTNSFVPQQHDEVKITIRSTGWVLFHGEIEKDGIILILGLEWRKWQITCADYNIELPRRLVGALDGRTWMDPSGFGFFQNIDEHASSLKTDKLSVQQWMDHYIRVGAGAIAFETDTFVEQYLDDVPSLIPEYDTLQGALEKLAALIVQNLQFWVDPDDFFHWVTIPAWQDLAQEAVAVELDATASTFSGMFPEAAGPAAGLSFAPMLISGVDGNPGGTGFSTLKFEFDGATMPEQIYVRGGTGYVYNAPPLAGTEDKTVVHSPVGGTPGTYELTMTTTTKLWHVDGTGYVSVSYDTGSGGPYPVKWVTVPWNTARNKGGNYWKFLSGPYAGKLADDNTNVLNGYGHITVVKVTTVPGVPTVGIGGSGFVNEATQDATKRQAYLEAAVSIDRATRDAFGGQALYRGQTPTLRGSVQVRGIDGWRVGQLVKIIDERLPPELNNKYYIIQRVKSKPIPETGILEYQLDFGDGPQSRYSAQAKTGGPVNWPSPAIQIDISVHDLSPGPNSTQIITGQLVNGEGKPWAIAGKTVNWSFECYNRLGVLQTEGSIAPTVSITDKYGRAHTKLTTGPDTNLVYFVFADVKAT